MRKRHAAGIGIGLALMFGTGPVEARALLTVCIDRASPLAAMDARIAQAAAVSQGYGLGIEYFDGQGLGDGAFASDSFRKLAGGLCQLVLGFPVDAEAPLLPDGVEATRPYAQTGFVLATRKPQAAGALAGVPVGSTIGVIFETAPNLYFHDHPGLQPRVYRSSAAMIDAVVNGTLAAAMVWQPSLAQHSEAHPGLRKLAIQPLDGAHARWNLVALHGAESSAAATVFEHGIAALHGTGQLVQLLAPYAVDQAADQAAAKPLPAIRPASGKAPVRPAGPGHLLAVAAVPAPPTAGKRPAIYTLEQARSGLMSYAMNCAFCHGAGLEGRTGPALKGEKFASAAANFLVGDIFFVLAMQMPAGKPGSLPKDEYAAVMAYLLQQNGYPAGKTLLDYEQALMSEVQLIYSGP